LRPPCSKPDACCLGTVESLGGYVQKLQAGRLRGMVLIDSAGVEVLARVSEWTRGNGGDLELRSASPALVEQLELARRAEARRHHPSAGRR
jgi:hypothetical protein